MLCSFFVSNVKLLSQLQQQLLKSTLSSLISTHSTQLDQPIATTHYHLTAEVISINDANYLLANCVLLFTSR